MCPTRLLIGLRDGEKPLLTSRQDDNVRVLETARLVLRRMTVDDAQFMLELLNDPAFLRYVGDRGIRTVEGARQYIARGPLESYARVGFGLYLVELKETGEPLGICGLVKRDTLQDVDIGFGFLPRYRARGYAVESATAVLAYGKDVVGLRRIVAIVSHDNERSANVLGKIGMTFERMILLSRDEPEIRLFAWES